MIEAAATMNPIRFLRMSRFAAQGLPRSLLLAALLTGLTACTGEAEDRKAQKKSVEVEVFEVQPQAVELFTELPGRTTAFRVAQVRPQVNGLIRQRHFEEGSQVQAGQILYQLDDQTLAAGVQQAEATLDRAQASAELAQLTVKRMQDVAARGAVSQQQLDEARAGAGQAIADVALARAQLNAARVDLAFTRIQAPIEGLVGRSFVTEGALVTANQASELTQVTQLDPIYVDIPRSSIDVLKMKRALSDGHLDPQPGQTPVQLILEDGSHYAHTGQLQFSDVTVDPATGSVTLRARFPNPDHELLPGMYVQARISEGRRPQALLVPQHGVTRDRQGNATALLVDDDNTVNKRTLSVKAALGSYWLVTDGLQAGDRVLLSGHQRVRPGDTVTTVPTNVPPGPQTDNRDAIGQDAAHG